MCVWLTWSLYILANGYLWFNDNVACSPYVAIFNGCVSAPAVCVCVCVCGSVWLYYYSIYCIITLLFIIYYSFVSDIDGDLLMMTWWNVLIVILHSLFIQMIKCVIILCGKLFCSILMMILLLTVMCDYYYSLTIIVVFWYYYCRMMILPTLSVFSCLIHCHWNVIEKCR